MRIEITFLATFSHFLNENALQIPVIGNSVVRIPSVSSLLQEKHHASVDQDSLETLILHVQVRVFLGRLSSVTSSCKISSFIFPQTSCTRIILHEDVKHVKRPFFFQVNFFPFFGLPLHPLKRSLQLFVSKKTWHDHHHKNLLVTTSFSCTLCSKNV